MIRTNELIQEMIKCMHQGDVEYLRAILERIDTDEWLKPITDYLEYNYTEIPTLDVQSTLLEFLPEGAFKFTHDKYLTMLNGAVAVIDRGSEGMWVR